MDLQLNNVFCQWKLALLAILRSRSLVVGWSHRNMLRPKSGLDTGGGGAFGAVGPLGNGLFAAGRGSNAGVRLSATVALPAPLTNALPNAVPLGAWPLTAAFSSGLVAAC